MRIAPDRPARWLTIVAILALACSCAKRADNVSNTSDESRIEIGVYSPRDDAAKSWGTFDFYGPHATLAAFQGHLALESVGRLPAVAGEALAGAQVYRIVNAQEFHEQNKSRDMRCLSPALWLAAKQSNGELRVALLMLKDWSDYEPKQPGLCGSAVYSIG